MNQLVADGLAPLSYPSKHLAHRLLDMNVSEESSTDVISKSSILFGDFSQQSSPIDNIYQTLLTHSIFPNSLRFFNYPLLVICGHYDVDSPAHHVKHCITMKQSLLYYNIPS
jgi:hypothetical protein